MPAAVPHKYYLGKDANFSFSGGIANKDVRKVGVSRESSAEVDVTTRGSGDEKEFALARTTTTITVDCLDHTASHGATGTVSMSLTPAGPARPAGTFQVMSISDDEDIDGAVVFSITLKKTVTATGS